MTDENEQIKPPLAEDNPWYNFMQKSIKLDGVNFPHGHHWFWGIYFLHENVIKFPKINLKALQNKLPDGHWLKKIETDGTGFIPDNELDKISPKAVQNDKLCALHDYLNKIEYPKDIDFSGLLFENEINFSNLIFPVDVLFSMSSFLKKTDFQYTVFSAQADFSKTTFFGGAQFNHTEFFMFAEFNGTCFSSTVEFFKAQLSIAEFKKTVFNGFANFSDTTFTKMANFKEAIFSNQARFNNAKFLGYTTFENTTFELNAPRFYGAELNDEMFWNDIKLPTLEKVDDKELEDNYKKRIKDNENAYENLSTKLGNQRKYRDELFFFRQELSCQRKLAESRTSGLAFRLYELFSGYGYNIGRAFWWWVGHIALGAVVIAFIAMCGGMRFHESLPCAIPVSFANANPYTFFGFESSSLKACYTKLDKLAPISFALVKAIQTVIGIALLFLVGLTLRVRFRLK